MTFKRVPLMAGLLALGMVTACPESETDPKPVELLQLDANLTSAEISTQYRALSQGVADSVLFMNDSSSITGVLPEECVDSESGSVCEPVEITLDDPAMESANWLQKHLFNDAHLRADLSTPTTLLFCLKSADLCAVEAPLPGEPAIDAECVDVLTEVPICVRVTSVAEGSYDLQLLLGQQQEMNPADLHISAQRLAGELKLADVKRAVEAVAAASGGTLPEGWPKQLAGEVGVALVKHAEKSFSATFSVRQDVAIDLFASADPRRTELRFSAAPEFFKVAVDGLGKVVSASADVRAIDLKVAAELLFAESNEVCEPSSVLGEPPVCHTEETHYTGKFLAQLAGVTGAFDLAAAAQDETLTVRDIGLGSQTSKILFDKGAGQSEIFAVDLNAELGRRVAMTMTKVGETAQVSFAPGLALRVAHDFSSLTDQFEGISGWALKAVSQASLSGTEPAVLLEGGPTGDGLKVVAGQLALSASGMVGQSDVSLSAAANQCVWTPEVESPDAELHPFASLVVGACQ